MKEKAFEKAAEYIDAVAAKLGVAAEHVYEILVRQAYVNGVRDIVMFLVLSAVTYLLVKLTIKMADSHNYDFFSPFIGLFAIVAAFIAVVCLYTGIGELVNPEYYAIKEILDTLGGK